MATFLQLLPKGFRSEASRQTDGAVYSVVEGRGRARVGSGANRLAFDFAPRDLFVVPSWQSLELEATDECVLFSFSDRPVHEALGIWREDRARAA